MRACDLFCGAGGSACGLRAAGFEVALGMDNDAGALGVYGHNALQMNLGDVEGAVRAIRAVGPIQLLAGSPPCTDFSSAGDRVERETHAGLTVAFAQVAVAVRVRCVMLENVPQLLSSRAWAEAKEVLVGAGYTLLVLRINAAACGVAQERRRVFVIGMLGGSEEAMRRVQCVASEYNRTPSDAPTVRDCLTDPSVDLYWYGGRNLLSPCVRSTDEPAPTLRTNCLSVPPAHYSARHDDAGPVKRAHVLSVAEAAAIASFPPRYFEGVSRTAAARYIGNCVPPRMAERVARWCVELLSQPIVPTPAKYIVSARRQCHRTSRLQRLVDAGLLRAGGTIDQATLRYTGGGKGDGIVSAVLGASLPRGCVLSLTLRQTPSVSQGQAPLDDLHLYLPGHAQPFRSFRQLSRSVDHSTNPHT